MSSQSQRDMTGASFFPITKQIAKCSKVVTSQKIVSETSLLKYVSNLTTQSIRFLNVWIHRAVNLGNSMVGRPIQRTKHIQSKT